MCLEKFLSEFSKTNHEKLSYNWISANSSQSIVQQPADPNYFNFYLWQHLNTLVYSTHIENEDTLYQRTFMSVKLFTALPGPCKGFDSPSSEASCIKT